MDGAWRHTAERLDANVALQIAEIAGAERPDLSKLEALDEPEALSTLRSTIDALLPNRVAFSDEAYFFLGGGKDAGLQPMQLTRRRGSHWWILKDDEIVIDLTLRPREGPGDYPYENGTPRGFMQTGYKRPSKRAAQLIERVQRQR